MITPRERGSPSPGVFVGQAHALTELDEALEAAERGQGSLVLVLISWGLPITRPDLHFFYNLIETVPLVGALVWQIRRSPLSSRLAGDLRIELVREQGEV